MLQRSNKELKADITDRIARDIIRSEEKKRASKTERLRQMRLAAERETAPAPLKAPARRRVTGRSLAGR